MCISHSADLFSKQNKCKNVLRKNRKMPAMQIIDFSNIDAKQPKELVDEESNCGKRKPVGASDTAKVPPALMTGLNLASCSLVGLDGLSEFINSTLWHPEMLVHLDLSCNKIVNIDEIGCCQNLSVLYLHGNCIADVHTLEPLLSLPKLTTLTVHGNPLVAQSSFRYWLIRNLPNLRRIDFSPVTNQEREDAFALDTLGAITLKRRENFLVNGKIVGK